MIIEYFETMQQFEAATNDTEASTLLERANNIAEGCIASDAPLADRLRVAVSYAAGLDHDATMSVMRKLAA